jgi:hypothetical protein
MAMEQSLVLNGTKCQREKRDSCHAHCRKQLPIAEKAATQNDICIIMYDENPPLCMPLAGKREEEGNNPCQP